MYNKTCCSTSQFLENIDREEQIEKGRSNSAVFKQLLDARELLSVCTSLACVWNFYTKKCDVPATLLESFAPLQCPVGVEHMEPGL